jgi:UDP-N-acetylmuramate dehydrogenase
MRNPCEPAPAYLIEQAGLKGLTVGGIQVSTKHSGFFINLGYGSAKDFLLLADIVKKRINTLYGVKLNEEYKEL